MLGVSAHLPSQGFCYFLVCIFITLKMAEIILKLKIKCIKICNKSWIIWVFWTIWHSQMLDTPYHYYFLSKGSVHTITLPILHQKQVSKTSHCFGFNFLWFVETSLVFYVPTYFFNFSAFLNYILYIYSQRFYLIFMYESQTCPPITKKKLFFKNFYYGHFQT